MSSRRTSQNKGEENLVKVALSGGGTGISAAQPGIANNPANVANLWLANFVSQPGRSIGYSGAVTVNANSALNNSTFVAGCVVTPVQSGRFRVRVHGFIVGGVQAPNLNFYIQHQVSPNTLNTAAQNYNSTNSLLSSDFTSALMVLPALGIGPASMAVDYVGNVSSPNTSLVSLSAGPFTVGTPVAFYLGAASALVANNASVVQNGIMIEVQEIP